MATSSVCGCFGNLRSRYKRLVDNIFPSDPSQGLVKSNMEKLTFYALQAPEKLDRIGEYMYMKINNHLYRKRFGYVYIAMEAMDHLLLACRSSSLNLFVESFLKMVSTLLESSDTSLQICATKSFIKFANIDEDTPSYHRRYEFFISRFSQMCYGSHENQEIEKTIRLSGLQGLQGVVRKTVNDDLQANIWDDIHMSKIVPALLYNIESNQESLSAKSSASVSGQVGLEQNDSPAQLADLCLRELVTRAGFNNIANILYPLLTFMDTRSLWLKNEFPLHIFKLIMYSIQNQYSYRAIELLLSHLDKHKNSEAEMRASVIEMISASVGIATGGSIGPSILEVFNTLLKHLNFSVEYMLDSMKKEKESHPEKTVQNAIINAAGAFSSILADYQRVDVMLFIILRVPQLTGSENQDKHNTEDYDNQTIDEKEEIIQSNLLKCLLQVAESHSSKQFSSTFSVKLMDALLTGLLLRSPHIRLLVQKILISLLDRHKNLSNLKILSKTTCASDISFNMEKCSRHDSNFIKKNVQQLMFYVYESCCVVSNVKENLELLSYIISLLVLEFGEEENIVELIGFVLGLQKLARNKETKLSLLQQSCLHSLVLLFFFLIADLTTIPAINEHCQVVLRKREEQAVYLLPSKAFYEDELHINQDVFHILDETFYFNRTKVVTALRNNNYETNLIETPYVPKPTVRTLSSASLPEHFPIVKADSQLSVISGHSAKIDATLIENITYEDLKDALRGERKEKKETVLNFKKDSFQTICAYNDKMAKEVDFKIKKSLEIACRTAQSNKNPALEKDIFEIEFPSLFVY